MTADQVKKSSLGNWESLAVEVRPSSTKSADGSLKPFYLTRNFSLFSEDRFELTVTNYADPSGKIPMAKMFINGHIEWQGEHAITAGAQKVNFTADEEYTVTPLLQGFVDILNQYTKGFNQWKVGETQSIFKKAFVPFGLSEGQVFKEYDLIYVLDDMMFWGARHVDGRGFDKEENRPTNLQIPLIRKK
jgi:Adenomatosis polyposis coli down-regulated 1